MEVTAYRILYDNIHDFKNTANLVESDIRRLGLSYDRKDAVPGMNSRTYKDMWVSMKTVSHFNLGIALELLLKLLLFLNRVQIPNKHILTELYDKLPEHIQQQLESTFQTSQNAVPGEIQLIAFMNTSTRTPPPSTPLNRDIWTLKGFCEYFDNDVLLWQKRYSWELIDQGKARHYLSDFGVFIELIDRTMAGIERK